MNRNARKPGAAHRGSRREWLKLWCTDAAKAWCISFFLIALHWYIEQRPIGEYLRNFEYTFIQQALISEFQAVESRNEAKSALPVVVDISPFRLDKAVPTDRAKLAELVETLEAMNAAAIGVDVDFSPDDQGRFISPEDPQLFLQWMRYGNVRVGVFRRAADSQSRWLGRLQFQELAAGMMLPLSDAQYAYHFTSSQPPESPRDALLQMPAALYAVRHPGLGLGAITDRRLMRRVVESRVTVGEFPIDYSYLDQIAKIPYRETRDLARWQDKIDRRVVLIGDLADLEDSRCTAHLRAPVPGVLIHACSFATLNRGLLWNISTRTSLMCDLWLVLWLTFAMGLVRFLQIFRRRMWSLDAHAMEIFSFLTAAFCVVTASIGVIGLTHFFWPESLWISAGLFIHPYLIEVTTVMFRGIKGFLVTAATTER